MLLNETKVNLTMTAVGEQALIFPAADWLPITAAKRTNSTLHPLLTSNVHLAWALQVITQPKKN